MSIAKIALPAFAGVLIVGAVVTTLWMIGSASGERAKFSSLEIAPQEADAFFAINTDPTSPQWLAVNDSLGALGAKDPIREAIDEALAEVNLDWEDDILPVAGDEAFFSVPSFEDVEGSSGFVAGFQIADEDKAQEVFDDLRARAEDEGEELSEEEYEGVTIYYTDVPSISGSFDTDVGCFASDENDNEVECDVEDSDASDTGAVALFDGVLAIGGSTDDVKAVIDVVQGRAPSAMENERLTEFRDLQKEDFLMWGYADLATVWDIAEAGTATTIGGSSGEEPFETPEPIETEEPIETPEPTVTPVPITTAAPEADYRVTSFHADYTIDEFGTLFATETIDVTFGTTHRRGIVRDFDTLVPYNAQYEEHVLIWPGSVFLDGEEILFETPDMGDGAFRLITGEPLTSVTGSHTYVINYTIFGGVYQWTTGGPDAEYQIGFDATGTLLAPMEDVSVSLTVLQGTIKETGCAADVAESLEFVFISGVRNCTADVAGNVITFTPAGGEVPEGSGFRTNVSVYGESGKPQQDLDLWPIPGFDSGSGAPVDESFRVISFDADYTIEDDGTLSVVETIGLDFGETERHGITRDFELLIPYDAFNDERIQVVPGDARVDGALTPVNTLDIAVDQLRIQVGDVNETISGPHTYVIEYRIVGGVHQWSTGDELAYYETILNATGKWPMPLEQASVSFTDAEGGISASSCTVDVPEEADDLYFPGEYNSCFVELSGDTTATFTSDGPVEPGTVFAFLVGVNGESGRLQEDVVLVPDNNFGGDQFGDDFDFEEEPLIPFDIDTEELFEQLRGTYDRVGFSVSSTSDGFAFDVTVLHAEGFEPENAFEPTAVFDSRFAEMVPAETMFFFAGYDIYGQNWLPAKTYFEDVEFDDGKTVDDFLDEFADETGLDLEEDILALLTGEYAVAGDVSDWDENTPDFSVLTLLDVSDEAQAQGTLDELGDYLSDQGLIEIDDDGPVQRWTLADQDELQDSVGVTVSDGAIIAGYPDSAVEDTVAGVESSLASTDEWKRTVGLLPDDTTSIGFVSIARLLEEARAIEAEEALEDATSGDVTFDDLEALRSIGFATTSRENGFGVHAVLFVEDQ